MKSFFSGLLLFCSSSLMHGQIEVNTLLKDIDASGGVTTDRFGNVYISDFGPALGVPPDSTVVYKWDVKTQEVTVFATGFKGASGACFDSQGNFYQSNPFGNSISKVSVNGTVQHNWVSENLQTPIGLAADENDNIYVCNCTGNSIGKVNPQGQYETFATSEHFKCPNGLTKDDAGNLYACNFGDGKILKISRIGEVSVFVELPVLTGGPNPVGNGHVTWKNGFLFATTIGKGEIYKITKEGEHQQIAGMPLTFKNVDGEATKAGFSKPNGIAASVTGDTLYVNVSDPTWINNPPGLHPAHLRIITGICSLQDFSCED